MIPKYQLLFRIILCLILAGAVAGNIPESVKGLTGELGAARINGGQLMNESVPFQVSMQMLRRGRWRYFCSGSIVSEQHVLTAAHCVDKLQVGNSSVLGGTVNWQLDGRHRHRIVAKHVDPQYTMSPRINNDIAGAP